MEARVKSLEETRQAREHLVPAFDAVRTDVAVLKESRAESLSIQRFRKRLGAAVLATAGIVTAVVTVAVNYIQGG